MSKYQVGEVLNLRGKGLGFNFSCPSCRLSDKLHIPCFPPLPNKQRYVSGDGGASDGLSCMHACVMSALFQ